VFLAGSYLVKAAIGEEIDNETLGGATTHCEISGVTDSKFPNDQACLDYIRSLFDKLGQSDKAGFDHVAPMPPKEKPAPKSKAEKNKPKTKAELKERKAANAVKKAEKNGTAPVSLTKKS